MRMTMAWNRALAGMLTVCLVTGLSHAYVHLASSQHDYCVEHGQFEPHHDSQDSHDHGGVPSHDQRHDNCPWMAFATSPADTPLSPVALVCLPDPRPAGLASSHLPEARRAPVLNIAPKASPPRFAS